MEYVDLIIDNSSDQTDRLYTYGTELPGLVPGSRVAVSFSTGERKKAAYVHSFPGPPEQPFRNLKCVETVDVPASLPPDAIPVADWMRERYFCRRIDAVKCFAPFGNPPKQKRVGKGLFDEVPERMPAPELTGEQAEAMAAIAPAVRSHSHRTFLLHGVTSSGKTEVYLRTIEACRALGRSAILLVPEIALTGQTIRRLLERFGPDEVSVLHSRLSAGERYAQWMRIRQGGAPIVVGARSAVFAPLSNIGAILVDEAHETSYRSDLSPKYDTIEVAQQRAAFYGATVILGSATPSIESLYEAERGAYHTIRLQGRFNQAPLPDIAVVDMRGELRAGNKSIFSRSLFQGVQEELAAGRQTILFLNRRGYSTFLSCRSCGFVMQCDSCGIARTYHKTEGVAVCHYCGSREPVPPSCPVCGNRTLRHFGTGTEKVEEMAAQAFPGARIARLDLDTAKRKGSTEQILRRFAHGQTDILIGTQLVAKGLDFSNVGLVGIVAADLSLNLPDFRASERTYQLVTQAAGRAGRGEKKGRVLLQTYSPEHYAIQAAAANDHVGFYRTESSLRRAMGYPPYSDLIRLLLAAGDEAATAEGAEKIRRLLLRKAGAARADRILGPRPAQVPKADGVPRYQILVKSFPEDREIFTKAIWEIKEKVIKEKGTEWTFAIDVNPFGFTG